MTQTKHAFGPDSPAYDSDREYNEHFLQAQENYFNKLLRIRGHVFVNDVLDALKMQRTPDGAITGWLEKPGTTILFHPEREIDGSYTLYFNDQGEIYKHI